MKQKIFSQVFLLKQKAIAKGIFSQVFLPLGKKAVGALGVAGMKRTISRHTIKIEYFNSHIFLSGESGFFWKKAIDWWLE